MAAAVAERGALVAPGFDITATQALWTFVPGCSGKVVPGAPASASAGPAPVAIKTALAKSVASRFTTDPSFCQLDGSVVPQPRVAKPLGPDSIRGSKPINWDPQPKLCSYRGIILICRRNRVLTAHTDDAEKLRG
jgi:hypothetical protein